MTSAPGSLKMTSLSVIIPVRNESGNLRPAYDQLRQVLDQCAELSGYEILLIDDGSTDGGWAECVALAAADTRLRCLRLSAHYGQHAALCAGIDAATGEILLTCDADLQVAPHELPQLWRKVEEGFDLVRAWRRGRAHRSFLRRCLSYAATHLLGFLLQKTYRDLTSPYAALRRDLGSSILKSGVRRQFLGITAVQLAAKMTELPVQHLPRRHGRSHYTWRSLWRLSSAMIASCFPAVPRRLAWGAAIVGGFTIVASAALLARNVSSELAPWILGFGGAVSLLNLGAALLVHRNRTRLLRREDEPMYEITETYPPS